MNLASLGIIRPIYDPTSSGTRLSQIRLVSASTFTIEMLGITQANCTGHVNTSTLLEEISHHNSCTYLSRSTMESTTKTKAGCL